MVRAVLTPDQVRIWGEGYKGLALPQVHRFWVQGDLLVSEQIGLWILGDEIMAKVATAVRAPKRRRLSDLYVVGKELTFDDGAEGEDPITVWISKISPIEQRNAADEAAAERARVLRTRNLPADSTEKMRMFDQLVEMGGDDRETLVNYLISPKMYEAEQSAEARLAAEDPWSKDDYLQGLQDLWNKEHQERYLKDPEDEDALQTFNELKKFAEEVEEAVADEREALAAGYEGESTEEMQAKAVDLLISTEADFAWMNEFRKWQVFYAVRYDDNHKERYFESREEVDMVDSDVFARLLQEFLDLSVDVTEGKDSEETPNSSEE